MKVTGSSAAPSNCILTLTCKIRTARATGNAQAPGFSYQAWYVLTDSPIGGKKEGGLLGGWQCLAVPDKELLASGRRTWHAPSMSHRSKRYPKSETLPAAAPAGPVRTQQLFEQRRRDQATRSTLSRLRNRKSDLK